jgi:hypothetical protein
VEYNLYKNLYNSLVIELYREIGIDKTEKILNKIIDIEANKEKE